MSVYISIILILMAVIFITKCTISIVGGILKFFLTILLWMLLISLILLCPIFIIFLLFRKK